MDPNGFRICQGHSLSIQGGRWAQAPLCVDSASCNVAVGEDFPGAQGTSEGKSIVPGFPLPLVNALTASRRESSSQNG